MMFPVLCTYLIPKMQLEHQFETLWPHHLDTTYIGEVSCQQVLLVPNPDIGIMLHKNFHRSIVISFDGFMKTSVPIRVDYIHISACLQKVLQKRHPVLLTLLKKGWSPVKRI